MPAAAAAPARTAAPATSAAPTTSRLGQVQQGRQTTAKRYFIYGDGGLGKTTLAAGAPVPIFLDINQGSAGFDVARYTFDDTGRTKPASFIDLLAGVHDIARNGAGKFKTLVLDALSDVEQLVFAEVMRRDGKASSIVDGNLGYNKGYDAAVNEWRRLAEALEAVWSVGIDIVLIDHTDVKKEKNAGGADYGRAMPKIHPLASKFLHVWSDYTLFLEVEAVLVPDNVDERKAKKAYAQSSGVRVLHARPSAEYMAKSRPELPDPMHLPASGGWQFIADEIAAAKQRRVEQLVANIEARLEALDAKDVKAARAALERAGDDDSKLEQLDNWCATRAAKGA